MKKVFLLLSFCAGLTACSSTPEKAKEQYTLAESESEPENTLATDSTTGANVTAVAHQPQVDTSTTKLGNEPTGGAVATGAKLIQGADCMGCHRENEKLIGPAYRAVAQKYPSNAANVTMLAKKVISGGKGNWGEIAMTPHPNLSLTDAQEMTRYILSLR